MFCFLYFDLQNVMKTWFLRSKNCVFVYLLYFYFLIFLYFVWIFYFVKYGGFATIFLRKHAPFGRLRCILLTFCCALPCKNVFVNIFASGQNAYRHGKPDFCTFRFAKCKQKFRVQIRIKKKRFDWPYFVTRTFDVVRNNKVFVK